MKVSKRSLVVVVAALTAALALLVLIGTASAQQPVTGDAAKSSPDPKSTREYQWSALDKVDTFRKTLTTAGFSLEPGEFSFWDLVKRCCEGTIPDTLANNPWPNTYIAVKFASDQGVGLPGIDRYWRLREDEAIVLVGQTPPAAAYFSYQTIMITLPDDPTTPNIDESRRRLGSPVGDTINIGTVKTIGPDKYNRPIVYIITGNRETERRVRAAALKAGYPDAIINVETISPVIAPLGTDKDRKGSSTFAFVNRVAVPLDETAVEDYAKDPPYKVFRVTPNKQLAADAEPVPVLRVRGTGHTEMELYPALKKLRQAILNTYEQAGYDQTRRKELDTKVWEVVMPNGRKMKTEKPYVGLQTDIQVLGATRDTNYLATYPNFMLREGEDEFVIVFGVNHQKTGKATYSSFSIYADKDRWFGLINGTTLSPDFDEGGQPGDSARKYLPNDPDPNINMLYAWKVARDCHGEKYCMEVKVNDDPAKPFTGIDGVPYACNLYDFYSSPNAPILLGPFDLDQAEMFFLWRSYMEPATKVAPDDNELVYDRAIYFGPYFARP